jgi:hypothetical protein
MNIDTAKVAALVASIEIRFTMPIRLRVVAPSEPLPAEFTPHPRRGPVVVMWSEARKRESGRMDWLAGDWVEVDSDRRAHVLACVRDLIHRVVVHEVDESVYVDGVRVWDPHDSTEAQRAAAEWEARQ